MLAFTLECPVLPRGEGRDLFLALADHPQGRALHAAGGKPTAHLLPQERREVEADQIVERSARLLCVHQLSGQFARLRHGLADRIAGDLVERNPVDLLARELAARAQDLKQMPGDRFALAIGIGREIQ